MIVNIWELGLYDMKYRVLVSPEEWVADNTGDEFPQGNYHIELMDGPLIFTNTCGGKKSM